MSEPTPRSGEHLPVRYPAPLLPGDLIAVTAPSSGVPADLRPRLEFCVEHLRQRGFEVVVGSCIDQAGVRGVTSASPGERAAELMMMLTDPKVRAVVPPWGGEIGIDLLSLLDFDAIGAAEPTWLVGYSDTSTLMLPMTLRTGVATLHAPNLMDTPYLVPDPLLHWLEVATAPVGGTLTQGASAAYRGPSFTSFGDSPTIRDPELTMPGSWKQLAAGAGQAEGGGDGRPDVRATGRLIGGCLETVAMLPGTPFGDVAGWASRYAREGLIVYLEVAESSPGAAARMLHHVRLAGWFDEATAVMIGRWGAPDDVHFTQLDALASTLDDLAVPVLYDVDLGHVPPQLALVNGALATVLLDGTTGTLVQHLF